MIANITTEIVEEHENKVPCFKVWRECNAMINKIIFKSKVNLKILSLGSDGTHL